MSSEEFDALTRGLASRTISRRRALQLAAAGALGAAGLGVATEAAEAATLPSALARLDRGDHACPSLQMEQLNKYLTQN